MHYFFFFFILLWQTLLSKVVYKFKGSRARCHSKLEVQPSLAIKHDSIAEEQKYFVYLRRLTHSTITALVLGITAG